MSLLTDINAALVSAYRDMGLGLPTAYELRDFSPPSSSPWARINNFPADKFVDTLGDGGQNTAVGFFQISFFVPENDGTGRILGYADAALAYFKNGRRFGYNGQQVKINRGEMTPLRKDDDSASYSIALSFYWESSASR